MPDAFSYTSEDLKSPASFKFKKRVGLLILVQLQPFTGILAISTWDAPVQKRHLVQTLRDRLYDTEIEVP